MISLIINFFFPYNVATTTNAIKKRLMLLYNYYRFISNKIIKKHLLPKLELMFIFVDLGGVNLIILLLIINI
jgi:hypothetical protein